MIKKWYRICLILFLMISLIMPTIPIMAAEKEMQVTLDKDYVACEFKIVFETPGNYEAKLIDTNGNEHTYAKVDDMTMTCSLDKTPKGTYSTYITSPDVESIGKVTLSVTTNYTASTDIVSDNIMIGRDISGLKMYFKDDTFIATWTDETCGSVDVKVINLETSETIQNEKVSDKGFECKIENDVRQIAVTIVPSSSSNIKGAELTYNFNIDNNPDAKVNFPDIEKTNQDSITVEVVMGGTYGIYVEENGECVLTTDLMVKGTYDIEVPIENDGVNDIMFYIVDTDGNMRSTYKTIYKDTVAPSLSLGEEYDGVTINELDYTIIGTVANYDTLMVNGEVVEAATDGYFECPLTLHWGENNIKVEASDNSGNVTAYDIVITAEEPKFEVDSVMIIAVVIAIVVAVISFVKKKRKAKDDDLDEEIENEIMNAEESESSVEHKGKKKWFGKRKRTKTKESANPFEMPSAFSSEAEDSDYDEEEYEEDYEEDYEEGYGEGYGEGDEKDALNHGSEYGDQLYEEDYSDGDDDKEMQCDEEVESEYEEDDNEDEEVGQRVSSSADPIFANHAENDDCDDDGDDDGEEIDSGKNEAVGKEPIINGEPEGNKLLQDKEKQKDIEAPDETKEVSEDKKSNPKVSVSKNSDSGHSVLAAEYRDHVILRSRLLRKTEKVDKNIMETCNEEMNGGHTSSVINVSKDDSGAIPREESNRTVINIITDKPVKTQTKKYPHIVADVLYLVTVIALLFCLFHFVLLNGWIKSSSMEPTLMVGDITIANRLAYNVQSPQRGDIVFFEKDGELLSKRVIGVAGDTIAFVDGNVLVDDEILNENEYLSEEVVTECEKTFEVPNGCVFVLGDNREDSFDSRYWDEPYVQLEDIKGKLIATIPLGKYNSESDSGTSVESSTEMGEYIP